MSDLCWGHTCFLSKETLATKNFTSAVLLVYSIDYYYTIQSLNDVDGDVSTAYFKGSIEKATLKDLALLVFVDWSHVNLYVSKLWFWLVDY